MNKWIIKPVRATCDIHTKVTLFWVSVYMYYCVYVCTYVCTCVCMYMYVHSTVNRRGLIVFTCTFRVQCSHTYVRMYSM